jgi:hypothetical protein
MSDLSEIKQRHAFDRWKDVVFIAGAVLLTALSIGSVTSKAVGKNTPHHYTSSLQVYEQPELLR